jgi:alkylation response protein AidB-like acyl-CoA dehydrogenase
MDTLTSRTAEYTALREAGRRDLAFGRLYEGHVNALQLVAMYGTEDQRRRADADVANDALFGVWNTQDRDGVHLTEAPDGSVVLVGRKTFCSGAGRVARALVTAQAGDGTSQMLLVPMDRVATAIDPSFWHPLGMEESDSYAIDFTGVRLDADACIGPRDAYMREPWFSAGAARFVAVQTGGLERLVDELATFLVAVDRDRDPIQNARLGECAVHARTAVLWTSACAQAWERFDADGDARPLHETVDAARVAVERAALALAERVERAVGARGLLEPHPFARGIRNLRMYLRQPAPDAALARVGTAVASRERTR